MQASHIGVGWFLPLPAIPVRARLLEISHSFGAGEYRQRSLRILGSVKRCKYTTTPNIRTGEEYRYGRVGRRSSRTYKITAFRVRRVYSTVYQAVGKASDCKGLRGILSRVFSLQRSLLII